MSKRVFCPPLSVELHCGARQRASYVSRKHEAACLRCKAPQEIRYKQQAWYCQECQQYVNTIAKDPEAARCPFMPSAEPLLKVELQHSVHKCLSFRAYPEGTTTEVVLACAESYMGQ
eukprot:scaffold201149_cov17-Tisochrysis_lutea.AAC.2